MRIIEGIDQYIVVRYIQHFEKVKHGDIWHIRVCTGGGMATIPVHNEVSAERIIANIKEAVQQER